MQKIKNRNESLYFRSFPVYLYVFVFQRTRTHPMDIALSVAAFLLSLIGIAGCILPVIPGVVLSYAGLLCAAVCGFSTLSSECCGSSWP